MPSMIIRPLPDWNETLIRSDNNEDFWHQIDAFWNETIDVMRNEYEIQGIELDYGALLRLRDCLGRFSKVEQTLSDSNCPMIFDSWNCWDESKPGTVQKQPCPNFPHLGFSANRPSFKTCTESGEWWRHPETNMTWSNYTQCINIQDLEFRNTVNVISLSGWGISLFFMAISLFIFFYFKSLDCGRIKMHKNLFLSMSGNNILWIIWYSCVLFQHDVWSNNPVWCRVLHVAKTYFMISTYTWMLCEGAYLQLLLMNTWGVKTWQLWTLVGCGWGLPIFVLTPYTIFRALSTTENSNCWMDTGDSIWFLAVPVIIAISFNVMIVINVIRLIKRKRNVQSEDSQVAGGPNSVASTLKAARAALMLIPILGIHFLLMPIRPEQGTTLEYFYEVFSAVSSSYQGFFVSIIFCFINNDVLDILKKRCCRGRHRSYFNADSAATIGRGYLPPRTTCISVTNSPTLGTPRFTSGSANNSVLLRSHKHPKARMSLKNANNRQMLLQQQQQQILLPSHDIMYPSVIIAPPPQQVQQRKRTRSLTSDTLAPPPPMVMSRNYFGSMKPSNFNSLRSGDRNKRRSCAGGIMTESLRLLPQGKGNPNDPQNSDIPNAATDDEAITQL